MPTTSQPLSPSIPGGCWVPAKPVGVGRQAAGALAGLEDGKAAHGCLQAWLMVHRHRESSPGAGNTLTPTLISAPRWLEAAQSRGMREGSQRRRAKSQACWTTSSEGMMPRCTVSNS